MPSGDGEAEASLSARGHVELIGGVLDHGKQSVMNSRLPKRTVSLREKPPHVKRSLSVATTSINE
jgi:hypothetical protein